MLTCSSTRKRGGDLDVVDVTPLATGQALDYDQHFNHLQRGLVRVSLRDTVLGPHDIVVKLDLV